MQRSPKLKHLGLLIRAIYWVIWVERNNRIFSFVVVNVFTIIGKIDHLLIALINASSDSGRLHLDESLPTIRSSLVFADSRIRDPLDPPASTRVFNISPSTVPP